MLTFANATELSRWVAEVIEVQGDSILCCCRVLNAKRGMKMNVLVEGVVQYQVKMTDINRPSRFFSAVVSDRVNVIEVDTTSEPGLTFVMKS